MTRPKFSAHQPTPILRKMLCLYARIAPISELWASVKDISIRQENHQRTTLIVLKIYFVKLTNISGDQTPFKKTGRHRKAKRVGNLKIQKMKKTFWIISIVGSGLGLLTLIGTLGGASGAPQEAAGAAIAVAFAVIPYCVARAISEMQTKDSDTK